MAELELKNLVKIYPYTKVSGAFGARKHARELLEEERSQPYTTNEGVIAVQDFSLSVEHGEFVILLGPSGCGKTTVLRMIAGLEPVSAGQILLDGKDISTVRPQERDIAMIFQNYALYPHLNVYDNIAYTLKNQHVPRDEIRVQVEEIAFLLGLTDLLERRPKELSGGEQQRVAIGRALVRKPKLFLLDEPFSNLDAALRAQLRQDVKRIHEKLGTTFIYVTHDQAEAFALGSRIVVMQHGMIEQQGTPKELYNHPANTYVGTFVGVPQMNILDAQLEKQGNDWIVTTLGTQYAIPERAAENLTEKLLQAPAAEDPGSSAATDRTGKRPVLLGIRPVHITLSKDGIKAVVEYAEPTGSEYVVRLKVQDIELTAVLPGNTPIIKMTRNTKVRLNLQPEHFHLFGKESNKRIN